MPNGLRRGGRWGVILAGGDGVRLRPVTRFISGDDRPKQFCTFFDGQTLLGQTRQRITSVFPARQTLFVLTQQHEQFYREELADVSASQLIIQPTNRGTLPAILVAALHAASLDSDATLAFFPSDHHYTEEKRLMIGVEEALRAAHRYPREIILLGAGAKHPEVSYGWIEAADSTSSRFALSSVVRFWEKPSSEEAQGLWEKGCLWNTFIMIGKVNAFLQIIRETVPEVFDTINSSIETLATNPKPLSKIYSEIGVLDFSKQILSVNTARLRVLSLGDVGWSDLGEPARVLSTVSRHRPESAWVDPLRRTLAASAS